MSTSEPPGPEKPAFSRQFDTAIAETRLIDAFMQADGWTLAQFEAAPPWLREVYNRHAIAAITELQKMEGGTKPA